MLSTPVFAKETVEIASLTISPESVVVSIGERVNFRVEAYDSDGNPVPNRVFNRADIILSVENGIGEIVNKSQRNPLFEATNAGIGSIVAKLGDNDVLQDVNPSAGHVQFRGK